MGSFRMKAKESLAASPGTSQAIQSNEIDIVNHGEAPVIFEDFVKAASRFLTIRVSHKKNR